MSELRLTIAEVVVNLEERMPCLPGKRHTFGPLKDVCLCGKLSRGVLTEDPFVCLLFATGEK